MFLLEEILIELAMIASVIAAVGCLAYLLQASARERVYRRRCERRRRETRAALLTAWPMRPSGVGSRAPQTPRDKAAALREKRV